MLIEKGMILNDCIIHTDRTYFDFDDSGAILRVIFVSPNSNEVSQFDEGVRFEMKLTEIRGVMVFTFKFGNLQWIDAPYSPHLSLDLTGMEEVPDDAGYLMTIILIDGKTGRVENTRTISLSTGMSKRIKKAIEEQLNKPFNKEDYYISVNKLLNDYSTKQLASMADTYYKLN